MKNTKNKYAKMLRILATQSRWFCAIALAAVIVFSMAACRDDGDDGNNGYWLIAKSTTYTVTNGIAGNVSSSTEYNWIKYRNTSDKNYEQEYETSSTTGSTASSTTWYHFSRNGQTYESTTQSDAGTSTSTTTVYDSESGLTSKQTTSDASGTTIVISYNITSLGDSTYRQSINSYTNNGTAIDISMQSYSEYKIQNGRTLEQKSFTAAGVLSSTVKYTYNGDTTQTSSYDANDVLFYTMTATKTDNAAISAKLPDFSLYRYEYSSSPISNSYQTAEVVSDSDSQLLILTKTYTNNALSSQTESLYKKIIPNGQRDPNFGSGNGGGNGNPSNISNFEYYEENGNSITIFRYIGAGGNVTIPAQINGKPVTSIWDSAFYDTGLTSITIPDSVTEIGNYTFSYCTNLTSVTIPNSVTSIGIRTFDSCTSLTSITIPDSVTSIGEQAFFLCDNLTSITIPDSVTSIGDAAFGWCTRLTVTIGNNVTSIGEYAFYRCPSLTSVTIPNSVTSIGYAAFGYCNNLTSVTFQGTIASTNFNSDAFPGDLRAKYLAADGGIGTYTTTSWDGSSNTNPVWTKK